MNPVILYLASGEGLYPGAAILLVALALSIFWRTGWRSRIRNFLAWVGLAMVIMACPPVAWWIIFLVYAGLITWYFATSSKKPLGRIRRTTAIAGAVVLLVAMTFVVVTELGWRPMPVISLSARPVRLTVIGDSISAGISRDDPWPTIFQKNTGIEVRNLAKPGDQMADALDQANKLTADDRLLLLEIGGNDLIAGTPTADFHAQLDRLLAACVADGRTIIMYELPLLPHRLAYGRSQRKLATKYHITLIPKRFLIDVLAGADATSDGLHLSPAGAKQLAVQVEEFLRLEPAKRQ